MNCNLQMRLATNLVSLSTVDNSIGERRLLTRGDEMSFRQEIFIKEYGDPVSMRAKAL